MTPVCVKLIRTNKQINKPKIKKKKYKIKYVVNPRHLREHLSVSYVYLPYSLSSTSDRGTLHMSSPHAKLTSAAKYLGYFYELKLDISMNCRIFNIA